VLLLKQVHLQKEAGAIVFEEEFLAGWILSQRPHDLVRSAAGILEMRLTRCYSKRCECEKEE